jgi:hypothetical protein
VLVDEPPVPATIERSIPADAATSERDAPPRSPDARALQDELIDPKL